ncbi:hypothetical protein WI82_11615 [Burkholderia ubonensis]|nr:hypothetical protein WI82_11615 [Burkholderia ubonensis]
MDELDPRSLLPPARHQIADAAAACAQCHKPMAADDLSSTTGRSDALRQCRRCQRLSQTSQIF